MELNIEILTVLVALVGMIGVLVADRMRPGMVLFSVVVLFICCGILSPKEAIAGFSNKGMVTVALLFLVSEGVRRSNALGNIIARLLPEDGKYTIRRGYLRTIPLVASASAFLNNTPIVVIFVPIIKNWARKAGLPVKKFLIPISYAAILGGICTLIGTSTNLVVHGMMLDNGFDGMKMFEIGYVGIPIAVAGMLYIYLLGGRRLPDDDAVASSDDEGEDNIVEAVLGARFPGINTSCSEFDFEGRYGARIREIRRGGIPQQDMASVVFHEGDTLILETDGRFIETWNDSRVFLILSDGEEYRPYCPPWKKWLSLGLLLTMITGATLGTMPFVREWNLGIDLDMFFWVCLVTVIMAVLEIFPAKKYTKFISWDVLVTISLAFAISRAMTNSGMADFLAAFMIDFANGISPIMVLAVLYVITNIVTELITNNAAAAFAFPVAMSAAEQLGVDPMPFFITICIAASASFSSPIGYQTNMIVQGIGNYKFGDFVRIGLPLNIIAFLISMLLIPVIWPF